MALAQHIVERLADSSLLKEAAYVAGRWVAATDGDSYQVMDPSDQRIIAAVPDVSIALTKEAIDVAYVAQKPWAARSAKERGAVLRKWYDLILANVDDLATILTAEMGKPHAEAKGEVLYGASYVEWYAEEAKRLYGDVIPGHTADKRIMVIRQPVGVVGAITAWNFPVAMPLRKIAPALAAGCSMIFRPATQTPLSAIAIAVLAERAGVPAGLFSVVTTAKASEFGKELCANEKVRKLTFTGSTEVGRILMRQGADQIMKLSLELGGNAPFIVFDDADIDEAIEGAMLSKFRNAGQTCVCANRIYVQDGIYDQFAERFAARAADLKLGNGFEAGVQVGPLIDGHAVKKVEDHIADVVAKGGKVATGGSVLESGSFFFQPTVVTGATSEMLVAREETFGPLAALFRFKSAEDVIEMANDTEFGLTAYFYANDMRRVWRVAEALEYGMVGINTGLISTEVAPFGGVKQSGFGREGSKYGLDDFTEMKYLCFGGIA